MQVNFYQLTILPIDKVLPRLLEQIISQPQNRIMLVCPDKQTMQKMDALLWTFAQLSFLPHATEDDPHPQMQPILLTTSTKKNLNNANIVCALDYQLPEGDFDKLLVLFDRDDLVILPKIQVLHAQLKRKSTSDLNYFIQCTSGWEKSPKPPFNPN